MDHILWDISYVDLKWGFEIELITHFKVKDRSTDVYVMFKLNVCICDYHDHKLELASPLLFLPCLMTIMELTKFHESELSPTDSDSSSESEQAI